MLFIISFIMVVVSFKLNKRCDRLEKQGVIISRDYDSLLYIHNKVRGDIKRYKKAIEALRDSDPNNVMRYDLILSEISGDDFNEDVVDR